LNEKGERLSPRGRVYEMLQGLVRTGHESVVRGGGDRRLNGRLVPTGISRWRDRNSTTAARRWW
jgi:hypothetical protein